MCCLLKWSSEPVFLIVWGHQSDGRKTTVGAVLIFLLLVDHFIEFQLEFQRVPNDHHHLLPPPRIHQVLGLLVLDVKVAQSLAVRDRVCPL